MSDQLLERFLREEFAEDAQQAPLAVGLADAARQRAARYRRRRALAAVVVSLSVLAVAGLAARLPGEGRSTLPAVDGGDPRGDDVATEARPMAVISLHGVQMRVPASMVGTRCTFDRDVAYIWTEASRARPCPVQGVVDEHRTTVVMAAVGGPLPAGLPERPTLLPDGDTWQVVVVPDRDVRIDITSPDAEKVARLAASVRREVPPAGSPTIRPTTREEAVRAWLEAPDYNQKWTSGLAAPAGGRLYCAVTTIGDRKTGRTDLGGTLVKQEPTFDVYVWAVCERMYVAVNGHRETVGRGSQRSGPLLLHVVETQGTIYIRDADFPTGQASDKDMDRLFPPDIARAMRSQDAAAAEAELMARARADLQSQQLPYPH